MANPCRDGEIYTLSGINVDISSGGNTDTLCHLNGPFATLGDVPTNYAACMWTRYVEGLDPLNNHGLIVRDATAMHHYRARIVSNNPALVLQWDTID
jgi:hypothetical protein